MANIIRLKRSATASAVPSSGSLVAGELAVNTADGKLYLKKDDASVVQISRLTQTVDVQTFTSSDVWVKPAGALMVSITMSGGGAGGGFGDATTGGLGGGAGEGLTQTFLADEFDVETYVQIGAGGNGGIGAGVGGIPAAARSQKGSSSFVEFYDLFNAYFKAWAFGGGYGGGASPGPVNQGTSRTNQPIFATTQWGRGGIVGAGGRGGYFSGGGGIGATALGGGGSPGGDTNSFSVLDSGATRVVSSGGGAAQGATGATGGNGSDGEVHPNGFGTGAGGGGAPPNGSTTAMGGNGGNGIRGSGGGGGGRGGSTSAGSNGGNGGDGFVIITTVCYT